jgi:hypothetical protein
MSAGLVLLLGLPPALGGQEVEPRGLLRHPFMEVPAANGFHVSPMTMHGALRTSWSDDRDNGALWSGKGGAALLRGGAAYRAGPLLLVLGPEVTWASNGSFPLPGQTPTVLSAFSAPWFAVDLPRRFGDRPVRGVHPGQSMIEVRWTHIAAGVTSANVVRGPELRYPLVIGPSAPGFPSAFVEGGGTMGPLGRLKGRVQWGVLTESAYFDDIPDNDRTLFSGFFLDWAPGFAAGLEFGASITYRDPLAGGFSPSMLFQAFSTVSAQAQEQKAEDALAAVHARWSVEGFSTWATWGRNDYWLDTEDLLTDPDQSQLFAIGMARGWRHMDEEWTLLAEVSSTFTGNPRSGSIYRHSTSRQGYTHQGQTLGSSLGPGSRGAWLRLQRTDSARTVGIEAERIFHDLDVYNRILRHPDGTEGEDREWRFAVLYEGAAPGFGSQAVGLRLNGGMSLRWNRDYIRYSENADMVGPRESNVFLDVALTWDPSAARRPGRR